MKDAYIYFMTNWTGNVLYTSVTTNLEKSRPRPTFRKIVPGFTKTYNLTKLVYYEHFIDPTTAIVREKQIKKWRRAKKDALVNATNPDWVDLYNNGDFLSLRRCPNAQCGVEGSSPVAIGEDPSTPLRSGRDDAEAAA